jgi:hypothetical protein
LPSTFESLSFIFKLSILLLRIKPCSSFSFCLAFASYPCELPLRATLAHLFRELPLLQAALASRLSREPPLLRAVFASRICELLLFPVTFAIRVLFCLHCELRLCDSPVQAAFAFASRLYYKLLFLQAAFALASCLREQPFFLLP